MAAPAPTLAFRLRIFCYVVGGAAIGIVISELCRVLEPVSLLASDKDAVGNYLQFIGGIYAFITGFVIFDVWNQYTDSARVVEQEAGRLAGLARLSRCIGNEAQGKAIRNAIRNYTLAVLRVANADAQDRPDWRIDVEPWRELVGAVRNTDATSGRETIIYADFLRQLDHLTNLRKERHAIVGTRIPWILWDLLLFSSVLSFAPICVLSVESAWVHRLIAGSTASVLVSLLYVIRDLDNPFRGVFNLSFEPFERLVEGEDIV